MISTTILDSGMSFYFISVNSIRYYIGHVTYDPSPSGCLKQMYHLFTRGDHNLKPTKKVTSGIHDFITQSHCNANHI